MQVDHEKNALCAGYMVEFIHDATENYYEGGIYACRNCNNIKFPLYVLKILKFGLFYLPMLVDSCSHKLFAHKIPMHRKWVRIKCASHICFMMLPLCFNSYLLCEHHCHHHAQLEKALKKSACWETTQYLSLLFCVST